MTKTPLQQRLEEIEDEICKIRPQNMVNSKLSYMDFGYLLSFVQRDFPLLLALAKEVPQLLEALEEIAGKAEGINRVMECTGVAQQALSHYNSTISPLLNG